ncbi:MAG: epoxyqueuosine reductase QueH [Candidatus Shapirobacteria bacterium]
MSILVHTCCADCLLHLVEGLEGKADKEEIVVYFDNPNIHPRSEVLSRLIAVNKVALDLGVNKVIVADWEPKKYFEAIGENTRKPARCENCLKLRMSRLFKKAQELGTKAVTSTMLTSNYLNSKMIEKYGQELAKDTGIELVVPKKGGGQCKHIGFYKQNYCGCVYSLRERMEEKYFTPKSHQG